MIFSMTGFARKEHKANWGTAVWEIRSVNQRYLETFYRIPENFRGLEPNLRERLRKKLQRGKVECALRISLDDGNSAGFSVNEALAKQLIETAKWSQSQGASGDINPTDILRWPGVMNTVEANMDDVQKELLDLFDATLEEFIASRASEGENMKVLIEQRLTGIENEAKTIEGHMPEILEWQKDRIRNKFKEAKIELDDTRVEQEMVLIAQKSDITEEIDRLRSHVSETNKIMQQGGAIGRRLDFMMQEFNREANTLGSKSINSQVTQSAVELKVLIEQMREQIQNIE